MYIRAEINGYQVMQAAVEIADLASTAPHFQGVFSGPFAVDEVVNGVWVSPTPAEQLHGAARAVEAGYFRWKTAGNNSVEVFRNDDEWFVAFNTRRHALWDRGNGVGQTFAAIGGVEWARRNQGDVVVESVSGASWWEKDTSPAHPDILSERYSERMNALDALPELLEEHQLRQVCHWALTQDGEMATAVMAISQEGGWQIDEELLKMAVSLHSHSSNPIGKEVDAYLLGVDVMSV